MSIKTKYQSPSPTPDQNNVNVDPKVKLWKQGNNEAFVENINLEDVASINQSLEEVSRQVEISDSDISSIVDRIENLFHSTCTETFGYRKSKPKQNTPNKKKFAWFNHDCNVARNLYHRTRRLYNKYKTDNYKQQLKTVSKEYKKVMNKNKKHFDQSRIDKLRSLKSTNPKDYWRLLNGGKGNQTFASLDDLFEHFKKTNNSNETYENTEIPKTGDEPVLMNEEINAPITENEINEAAKSLKNNKSPGIDEILNEHIKTSVPHLLPTYHKLFNIIFDKGIIPDSWLIGNILPIYKNKGDIHNPENYRPITLLSCLGNKRLNKFAEENNILTDYQTGFRKGFSTVDNLYIINSLIEIFKSSHKKKNCIVHL